MSVALPPQDALASEALESTRDRFYSHVDLQGPEDCWDWTGAQDKDGYGSFQLLGKTCVAHRTAWWLANGEWPQPMCLHSCDRPPCVNLAHLREGTAADNLADRKERSRWEPPRGEDAPNAKLRNIEVDDIRYLWSTGRWTQTQIGHQFGVTQSRVSQIVRAVGN